MKKVFLLLALASLLQGCRSTPRAVNRSFTPIGSWTLTTENENSDFCGFELLADGSARSINLVKLCYERWRLRGDTLVLMGKSITNDDEQTFADTMRILKLTRNKIVLQEHDYKWEMVRMPE